MLAESWIQLAPPARLLVLILADGRAIRRLYPRALRDGFDVVLQCRLGIRVAKVGLHILEARELGHVGRAGAAEHLGGYTLDGGPPTPYFHGLGKEIIGSDVGSPGW